MHEGQGAKPGARARFSSNDHGDAISRTDLVGFGLVEDGPDPALDEIVRIAARITQCEKAFITFAHNDQLHVIASVGSSVSQTPAALSVCGVTYREDAPLIVPDLSRDNRFKDYPYIARADGNRFYAGFPMRLACGTSIGSLCVIDRTIREEMLDEAQLTVLRSLTTLAVRILESRQRDARLNDYLGIASDWIWEQDDQFRFTYLSRSASDNGIRIQDFLGKSRWDAACGNGESAQFWRSTAARSKPTNRSATCAFAGSTRPRTDLFHQRPARQLPGRHLPRLPRLGARRLRRGTGPPRGRIHGPSRPADPAGQPDGFRAARRRCLPPLEENGSASTLPADIDHFSRSTTPMAIRPATPC
ncbi:MAG: GAF domain-containing protein [Alphaproteobacteria bacterium]|nr:GAF domain-containing protein [Alphaproteobacteria bacterium]